METDIKFDKDRGQIFINKIPHNIVATATHTETLEDYLILKSRSCFKAIKLETIVSLNIDYDKNKRMVKFFF